MPQAYDGWLDRQEARIKDPGEGLGDLQAVARDSLGRARSVAARLHAGIERLASDEVAAEAFRFANRAMWQQRVHTVAATARRSAGETPFDDLLSAADIPAQRSWRPFQLAFVLLNVPSLVDPAHPERSPEHGLVDLLFFPTGGGKTEAYLGLTAFTLAVRRLQGVVGGHDGSDGLGVLMRYTLRLLTAQQFQRATALICACEVIRRERIAAGDHRWGETPFRIGMWVGGTVTPNYSAVAKKALDELFGVGGARSGRAPNPVQITACPWCGHQKLSPRSDSDRWRTLVFCGDELGECDFSGRKSPDEGLPVVTVDEEIYRLLPSLVIATVDKFAQLPWQGPLHTLFGRVERKCTRHGYRTPDLDKVSGREERDSHHKAGNLPAAKTVACGPLRPPDLIIQDELHLISGPLGTMVGLYESAIDRLASWTLDGHTVRPKVVASTATIRRGAMQVHALFWRGLNVFPPQVLDTGDSFFARQRSTSEAPGRLYLGVCAPGVRLKSVEARVFTTVLAAAQTLFEKYGRAADPWMTLVGYFNALRELGGARRIVDDDVSNRLRRTDRKGLARRKRPLLRELTSRIGSGDIPDILDQLGVMHDPDAPKTGPRPIDVLLATNMISVGVDVPRLGLMLAVGQPKATAEYIQATSRVGRDARGPGWSSRCYNWARPRDLSHYEAFEQYHATFYRHVEALSVTPFAARALDRGLTGLLITLARQQRLAWNPNRAAQGIDTSDPIFNSIVDDLARRAEDVSGDPSRGALVREMVRTRLDNLKVVQGRPGAPLAYRQVSGADAIPLLLEPSAAEWTLWTCPTSMREVEPNVNFVMDPRDPSIDNAPPFARESGQRWTRGVDAGGRSRRRSDRGRAGMKPVKSPRVGAVRPSQLMFSHGVGALVDLPNFSAVVAGLDDWDTTCQQTLVERRLLAAVRQMQNMEQVDALRTAPWLEETRNPFDDWARVGVTVVPFPRWMRCTGLQSADPDRQRAPRSEARTLSARSHQVRAQLPERRQASARRTRQVRHRVPGRPPRRVPVDRVLPLQAAVQREAAGPLERDRRIAVDRRPTRVRVLWTEDAPVAGIRRAWPANDAAVPGTASAPPSIRFVRLHSPAARGPARRVERLVPRDEIGVVAAGRARSD